MTVVSPAGVTYTHPCLSGGGHEDGESLRGVLIDEPLPWLQHEASVRVLRALDERPVPDRVAGLSFCLDVTS